MKWGQTLEALKRFWPPWKALAYWANYRKNFPQNINIIDLRVLGWISSRASCLRLENKRWTQEIEFFRDSLRLLLQLPRFESISSVYKKSFGRWFLKWTVVDSLKLWAKAFWSGTLRKLQIRGRKCRLKWIITSRSCLRSRMAQVGRTKLISSINCAAKLFSYSREQVFAV